MANFMGLVYATLKNKGIDYSKMSTDEAIAKFNELKGSDSDSREKENAKKSSAVDKLKGKGKTTEEKLEKFRKQGVEIKDSLPSGYKKIEGATTAPRGYYWANNKKSLFGGEYKQVLVKENRDSKEKYTSDSTGADAKSEPKIDWSKEYQSFKDTPEWYQEAIEDTHDRIFRNEWNLRTWNGIKNANTSDLKMGMELVERGENELTRIHNIAKQKGWEYNGKYNALDATYERVGDTPSSNEEYNNFVIDLEKSIASDKDYVKGKQKSLAHNEKWIKDIEEGITRDKKRINDLYADGTSKGYKLDKSSS